MKICFVNQNMSLGGSSTVLYEIIKNWPNSNDELYLLVFFNLFDNRFDDLYKIPNLKIIFLNKKRTIDFDFLKKLKKIIFDIKPDVINSHLTCTFYLHFIKAFRICNIYHTIHSEPKYDIPLIYRLFLKKSIKKGKIKLIGCCQYISNKAIKLYKVNCLTIRNGISLEQKYLENKDPNLIRFLYVGRLCKIKQITKIIDAFNDVNAKFELLICGSGSSKYSNKVKKAIHNNNNREKIHLIGNQNDIEKIYSSSDVLLLYSKREGLPMVLLEAAKYGVSYIVPNVGGISEIVFNKKNGFLINKNSFIGLKSSINQILLNTNILESFSNYNKENSKKFDSKIMALKYLEILRNE